MVGLIDKGRRVLDYDFEDPKVRAAKPSDSPCASEELSTHTNSSAKASECKENESGCHLKEEIISRLADIQSKQHQLASDQVELKLEMIGLRRFVANTFADLMGEIKNQKTGNFPKPSDLQMVVYTGGVESERKIDGNEDVDRPTHV
ncbi:Periplasmic beta-glucosidase [Olea europaea subsp. europaea]|uniref:Periplasmic beta-glucosidase n=1 Tax=Olea europaea subsp. europaea TaxID=158383 RepID=A0A8S0UI73_OLEEU|nr:Periplasmic beta-glucosidase [Olea europaea subsp. europaea]